MNTLILDFLNSYADNTNPQYAVMLKGKWGCGKMHIPADTRSAFPVISVQSPVSIQCCWQS